MAERNGTPPEWRAKMLKMEFDKLNDEFKQHVDEGKNTQGKVYRLELDMVKLKENTEHIKDRIDNGLSVTLNNIDGKLDKFINKVDVLEVQVKDNTNWLGKLKQGILWIAVIAVGGGLAKIAIDILTR